MKMENKIPITSCHWDPKRPILSMSHRANAKQIPHINPLITPKIPCVKAFVGANTIASRKKKNALFYSITPIVTFMTNIPIGSKSPVMNGIKIPYNSPINIQTKMFLFR